MEETEHFGPYTLSRRLATGGMGELYIAQRAGAAGFSKQVVVKRIREELAHNQDFVEMFLNEGRVAALLDHPNIVHIYDLGEVQGNYFMAMEYVPGRDLGSLLKHNEGPLDLSVALYILNSICEGIAFAHDAVGPDGVPLNLVHRDLNPQNALISYSGSVKIADFGIAKVQLQHRKETRVGVLKGKFGYLSPEQAHSKKIDRRSDIYTLGLLLFETTTGKRAIPGTSESEMLYAAAEGQVNRPSKVMPNYPHALEAIYLKATQKFAADRYQTVKEMHDDLLAFQVDHRLMVTSSNLAELMHRLFHEEISEERKLMTPSQPDLRTPTKALTVAAGVRGRPSNVIANPRLQVASSADLGLAPEPALEKRSGDVELPPEENTDTQQENDWMTSLIDPAQLRDFSSELAVATTHCVDQVDLDPPAGLAASHSIGLLEQPTELKIDIADTNKQLPALDGPGASAPIPVIVRSGNYASSSPMIPSARGSFNEASPTATPQYPVTGPMPLNSAYLDGADSPSLAQFTGQLEPGKYPTEGVSPEKDLGKGMFEPIPSRSEHSGLNLKVILISAIIALGISGPLIYLIGFSPGFEDSHAKSDMFQLVTPRIDLSLALDANTLVTAKQDAWSPDRVVESPDASTPDSALNTNAYAGYMPDAGPRPRHNGGQLRNITAKVKPRYHLEDKPRIAPTVNKGTGSVVLTSPQSLEAFWQGRRMGQAPATFSLPGGKQRITLINKALGIKVIRQVVIRPNKPTPLHVELKQGQLLVKVRPWAHVEINGVRKGTTPLPPLSLYEGVYQLKLINTNVDYSYTAKVTIRPGQVTKVVHRF